MSALISSAVSRARRSAFETETLRESLSGCTTRDQDQSLPNPLRLLSLFRVRWGDVIPHCAPLSSLSSPVTAFLSPADLTDPIRRPTVTPQLPLSYLLTYFHQKTTQCLSKFMWNGKKKKKATKCHRGADVWREQEVLKMIWSFAFQCESGNSSAQFATLALCPLAILAFFLPNIEVRPSPPPPSSSPAVSGLMFLKSLPAVNSTWETTGTCHNRVPRERVMERGGQGRSGDWR